MQLKIHTTISRVPGSGRIVSSYVSKLEWTLYGWDTMYCTSRSIHVPGTCKEREEKLLVLLSQRRSQTQRFSRGKYNSSIIRIQYRILFEYMMTGPGRALHKSHWPRCWAVQGAGPSSDHGTAARFSKRDRYCRKQLIR